MSSKFLTKKKNKEKIIKSFFLILRLPFDEDGDQIPISLVPFPHVNLVFHHI